MNNVELFKTALENLSGKRLKNNYVTMADMLRDFNKVYDKQDKKPTKNKE